MTSKTDKPTTIVRKQTRSKKKKDASILETSSQTNFVLPNSKVSPKKKEDKEVIPTVPKYTLEPTDNPNLFRVCNQKGDWVSYFDKKEKSYKYAVNYIIRNGFPKSEGFYNYLLSNSKEEAKKILETAGERGSRIHEAIRELVSGTEITLDRQYKNDLTGRYEPLTWDEWDCLRAFMQWCHDYEPYIVASETTVSTKDYAGTIDLICTIKVKDKRIRILVDFKTGSGIYPDYKLQTAAYAYALSKSVTHTAILRLGTRHKKGYEFTLWDYEQTKRHYQAFRATLNNFRLEFKEYKPNEEQIPTILKINLPKEK